MKIYTEMDLTEFEGWAGACDTLAELTDEQKKRYKITSKKIIQKG